MNSKSDGTTMVHSPVAFVRLIDDSCGRRGGFALPSADRAEASPKMASAMAPAASSAGAPRRAHREPAIRPGRSLICLGSSIALFVLHRYRRSSSAARGSPQEALPAVTVLAAAFIERPEQASALTLT